GDNAATVMKKMIAALEPRLLPADLVDFDFEIRGSQDPTKSAEKVLEEWAGPRKTRLAAYRDLIDIAMRPEAQNGLGLSINEAIALLDSKTAKLLPASTKTYVKKTVTGFDFATTPIEKYGMGMSPKEALSWIDEHAASWDDYDMQSYAS